MTNRQKIKRFCRLKQIPLIECEFIKNRDAEYGNTWDASYWHIEVEINNEVVEFDSYYGFEVEKDVENMLADVDEFINNTY